MAVELWIKREGADNYISVPVKSDTTVEISKSIDIESQANNLTKEWSKTITVPATGEVNELFSHIYDVAIYLTGANFNPNLKCETLIAVDGLPFFTGFSQLIEVRSDIYGVSEYDLACFGQSVNLISKIENKNVRDLDWSNLDHTFDSGIFTTWASGVVQGYGYVYPMIDYSAKSASPSTWDITDFYPAVYLKDIIDRTFNFAGFTYTSNFFNSDRFKSFIIPYAGKFEVLTEAAASGKVIKANRTTDQTVSASSSPSGSTKLKFNNEVQDPFNNYDPSTGKYTTGILNPTLTVLFNGCKIKCTTAGTYDSALVSIAVVRKRSGTWSRIGYLCILYAFSIGSKTVGEEVTLVDFDQLNGTFNQAVISKSLQLNNVQVGDEYYIIPEWVSDYAPIFQSITNGNLNSKFDFILTTGSSLTVTPPTGARVYGDLYKLNWNFPEDLKCGALLTDVIRLFNLVLLPDPVNESNIIIEPYDDFFTNEIVDWSDKLHEGVPFKSKPLSLSTSKSYLFSYAEGKDNLNKLHKDTYGRSYGTREKLTENEFTKEVKKLDVKFIPSVLTKGAGVDRYHTSAYEGEKTFKPSVGLRILMYTAGVLTKQPYTVTFNGTSQSFDYYAYAGHLDSPTNPNYDLNFGIPEAIYYASGGSITLTNSNLYTLYYSGKINQLTGRNSRVVEGVFKLDLTDIINLDFRKRYAFKGQAFRLLSIDGFRPDSDGLTSCKFINDQSIDADLTVNQTVFGGSMAIGQELTPMFNPDDRPTVLNFGIGNNFASENPTGLIIGDNNTIGSVGKFSLINCNNVTVVNGLSSVTAIECDNIVITRSGTYVKNEFKPTTGAETFVLNTGTPTGRASEGVVNFIVSTDNLPCTLYIDSIPNAVYSIAYDHIDGSDLTVRTYDGTAVLDEDTDGLYYFTYDGTTFTRLN